MNKNFVFFLTLILFLNCGVRNDFNGIFQLEKTIPLPGVSGRIDHMAYDNQRQLIFIAAIGNNTVEIVDLKNQKVIHSIKNLNEPQGIVFISENNSLMVSNGGNGECMFFNTETFQRISSVSLGDDADNVRYDSVAKRIHVGYGNGGVAVFDAITFKIIAKIKLSAHPEAFETDRSAHSIYVNIPDAQLIEVIDLQKNSVVAQWKIPEARSNFPMALDELHNRLFVGCRHPAELLVLDTKTGKAISVKDIDGDVDDIFYNGNSKEVYLSCGNGYLDSFRQIDADKYESTGRIATQPGARTSLFIPESNQIIIAAPAHQGSGAQLMIYKIK